VDLSFNPGCKEVSIGSRCFCMVALLIQKIYICIHNVQIAGIAGKMQEYVIIVLQNS
jgi:hypothetical protein